MCVEGMRVIHMCVEGMRVGLEVSVLHVHLRVRLAHHRGVRRMRVEVRLRLHVRRLRDRVLSFARRGHRR